MSDLPDLGLGPHRQPTEIGGDPCGDLLPGDEALPLADPVKVVKLAQAVCDACGWHTAPIESQGGGTSAATEWARVHRHTCPALPSRQLL